MTEDRIEVIVLGRKIGTATGWDELDTAVFAFYDFIPEQNAKVGACSALDVYYDAGITEEYLGDCSGPPVATTDLVCVVADLPRVITEK